MILAPLLALVTALSQQPRPERIAFVNVNVVPMSVQRVLPAQTVIIENGVITRVGTARSVRIPAGTQTIDATGQYLMPGLADLHVHLASNPEDEQRRLLKLFVINGVTTVLNLRGIPQILELRANVAAGRVLGPTIYTSGPFVNEPFVTTPEEVERAVVEQKRAGYDFIKLHGSLSRGAYARLMAVSRREGIRVVGHAPRNLGLEPMFEERQYAVAHAEEFIYDRQSSSREPADIERQIPQYARAMAKAGIWLMPNLTAFKTIAWQVRDLDAVLARPEMQLLPRSNRDGWGPATNPYTRRISSDRYPSIMALYHVLEKLVRAFQLAGVRMLIGTDAMNTGVVPGFSTHDELAELVTAGLTPYQALRAATANAGEFLGKEKRVGTVAVGQIADLILLDGNPIENVGNTRRIAGVLLRGQWISRAQIEAIVAELESK
jgi:hypothetical protein